MKKYGFNVFYQAEQEKERNKIPDLEERSQRSDSGRPQKVADDHTVDQTTAKITAVARAVDLQSSDDREIADDRKGQDEAVWKSRVNRIKIGLRLPNEKVERYRLWCLVNKMTLQDAVELAMDRLVDDREIPDDRKNWSSGRPHDQDDIDLIDDKLSSIMEFYHKWTKNKPNDKDKYTYEEICHLDIKIIQVGILLSISRTKQQIRSLKYCVPAIKEAASQKNSNPDTYLKYLVEYIRKNNPSAVPPGQ